MQIPSSSWSRKDPADAGIDPNLLSEAVSFAENTESTIPADYGDHEQRFGEALGPLPDERGSPNGLVIHEGEVVAEWGDVSDSDLVFSVTKSFLSLCAGVAFDKGLIGALDDPVGETVDDGGFDTPQNQPITWRHLLQNTSEWEGTLFGKRDRQDRREGINRKLQSPGTFWEYNDVRVNRLSLSLLRVLEEELPTVLEESILDPIGVVDDWDWYGYENSFVDVSDRELQSVTGGGHWGGGLHMSARDLARVGLLALNRGTWNGTQLLSEEWFRHSLEPCRCNHEYGFMWWLNSEQDLWPSAPVESFAAMGYGANVVWVDPTRDIVAVVRWFGDREENTEQLDELFNLLTMAVDGG